MESSDKKRDWRNPSAPWNPEDDGVVQGWQRCADGTWERYEEPEHDKDPAQQNLPPERGN